MNQKTVLQTACRHSGGLTLVEILIALLVLSIGLLGLAGLQTMSLKFNTAAYQRTQATALAYDIADRMRANRQAALNHEYDVVFAAPQACLDSPPTAGTQAEQDLAAWRNDLACRLPQSKASIDNPAGSEFTVTVTWDDSQGRQPEMEFQFTTAL